MAEYIESICRRCFHSYVCEQFNRHRDSHNEKCHFYNDHFVPAADVVAVKHGRWLESSNSRKPCSECGYRAHITNYCPNCGAIMDGEPNG